MANTTLIHSNLQEMFFISHQQSRKLPEELQYKSRKLPENFQMNSSTTTENSNTTPENNTTTPENFQKTPLQLQTATIQLWNFKKNPSRTPEELQYNSRNFKKKNLQDFKRTPVQLQKLSEKLRNSKRTPEELQYNSRNFQKNSGIRKELQRNSRRTPEEPQKNSRRTPEELQNTSCTFQKLYSILKMYKSVSKFPSKSLWIFCPKNLLPAITLNSCTQLCSWAACNECTPLQTAWGACWDLIPHS